MAKCRSCGAEIVWCVTESGKKMPADAEPSERGTLVLVDSCGGETLARVAECPGPRMYTSHFATCPNAAAHRKPRGQGGLPGVA